MSATPAPTASKLSNGRTNAPAGKTSILMRPPVAVPIVCAKRTALVRRPGKASGQSVTILNCRRPCAIAGAGKPISETAAVWKAAPSHPLARRVRARVSVPDFASCALLRA